MTARRFERNTREVNKNTGNGDYIRRLNRGIVLDRIRNAQPISRAQIAKETGMSRSTCSLLVDELISDRLVVERGKADSSGGRKPIMLELNYEAGVALGVKLMATSVVTAVVDLKGNAVERLETPVQYFADSNSYLNTVVDSARQLMDGHLANHPGSAIFGIGVGISGLVDETHGVSLSSSILHWHDVPLRRLLAEELGLPVYVENDVNAFALGEYWFGSGRGIEDFLCVTLGRGVGLGIVMGGQIYRGAHRGAGEFGHIRVSDAESAPRDTGGLVGTVEAFASDAAIVEYVRSHGKSRDGSHAELPGDIDAAIAQVRKEAEAGDATATAAFDRAGHYLGIGLSSLINLFDPELILIGGEGSASLPHMWEAMEKAVADNTAYDLHTRSRRVQVTSEEDLWVRGVATLVIRDVFTLNV